MNDKDLYLESINLFKSNQQLFHFTDFKALTIILETKKFRMSSLFNVAINDENEKKYVDDIWYKKIFFLSFTNQINEYF